MLFSAKNGILLDPACGSGGMFVQTGDFVNETGLQANKSMTFYGQEKVEYNAKLSIKISDVLRKLYWQQIS